MKVAIIQQSPDHLNLDGSVEKARKAIEEAAKNGADLIVFGETWFSGYPAWLDHCHEIAQWDYPPMKKVFAKMLDNCLTVEGDHMGLLRQLAKEHQVALVFGANERDDNRAKGTIFNSLFSISEDGNISNHHRKLVPTYTEKMLYGPGDGHGLQSALLKNTRVTAAVCWEHWMPLTRQALHDSGEDIHIAVWPKVHEMHQIASRQYAFEGRCFVLAAGQTLLAQDFPEELNLPPHLKPSDWVLNGGSCVIGPDGKYLVEPVFDEETIIYATLDLSRIKEESMTLDVSGHYHRPDVFDFQVNPRR